METIADGLESSGSLQLTASRVARCEWCILVAVELCFFTFTFQLVAHFDEWNPTIQELETEVFLEG